MKSSILSLTILLLATLSGCKKEQVPESPAGGVNTAVKQEVKTRVYRPILTRDQNDYMGILFNKRAPQQEIDSAFNIFSAINLQKKSTNAPKVNDVYGDSPSDEDEAGGGHSYLEDDGYVGNVSFTDPDNNGIWSEFSGEYVGDGSMFKYRQLAVEVRIPFRYATVRTSNTDKLVPTAIVKPIMVLVSYGAHLGEITDTSFLATILQHPNDFGISFVAGCDELRTRTVAYEGHMQFTASWNTGVAIGGMIDGTYAVTEKYNITNSYSINDGLVNINIASGCTGPFNETPPSLNFSSSFTCISHGDQRD